MFRKTKLYVREKFHNQREKWVDQSPVLTDFVPKLPKELIMTIFEKLSIEDFGKCLTVSKVWRVEANCDRLWKARCRKFGVPPTDDLQYETYRDDTEVLQLIFSDVMDLKPWAQAFHDFRYSSLFHWLNQSYRLSQFENEESCSDKMVGTNGRVIATLCKKKMVMRDVNNIRIPNYVCIPNFPGGVVASKIKVLDDYIIVKKSNILIIYKIDYGGYFCRQHLALATTSFQLISTQSRIASFVSDRFSNHRYEKIEHVFAMRNTHVWLRRRGDYAIYKVDLETGLYNIQFINLTSKMIFPPTMDIVKNLTSLMIQSVITKKREYLTRAYRILNLVVDRHLLIHTSDIRCNWEQYAHQYSQLESYSVERGEVTPIYSIQVARQKFYLAIHPIIRIQYHILLHENTTYVRAVNPLTGTSPWAMNFIYNCNYMFATSKIVCNKLLVLFYRFEGNSIYYVIDVDSGALLYESYQRGLLIKAFSHLLVFSTEFTIYLQHYGGK